MGTVKTYAQTPLTLNMQSELATFTTDKQNTLQKSSCGTYKFFLKTHPDWVWFDQASQVVSAQPTAATVQTYNFVLTAELYNSAHAYVADQDIPITLTVAACMLDPA
jgi:hypothetical protein